MTLQKLQGSFLDDYNRIEVYANELRLSNPNSDIVINLSKDALKQDSESIIFMSDMQKGLIKTVKNILPLSQHKYCVRHIEANWMKRFRSVKIKKLLWWDAWSSYEEDS
ncbi:hypothetical protein KY290_036955 [Solanum tuberosum]|uniref:MULE transposase domain-containing protein n=1 Tax=Solanum tuberosum TaxID=4113 RepID=A0ABQ7TUN2_SOLTU|nr:hypothetical protein KY290_036955 [Solanum tuberosum]